MLITKTWNVNFAVTLLKFYCTIKICIIYWEQVSTKICSLLTTNDKQ